MKTKNDVANLLNKKKMQLHRVENCASWFLNQLTVRQRGKLIYSVFFLGGSTSVLAVLATILMSVSGWMDGWAGGWVDGCMGGRVDG